MMNRCTGEALSLARVRWSVRRFEHLPCNGKPIDATVFDRIAAIA
jgi:hypothetical protein